MEICAFTGYRPTRFIFKYDESHPACIALKKQLAEEIERLYHCGVKNFLTGCAQGVDLWAGEAVLALRGKYADIKLICVLPYVGHERKWQKEQQERCRTLLAGSDGVIVPGGGTDRESYLMRGRFMVERADILLAVYSEQSRPPRSGTGYTVKYARALGKTIRLLDPGAAMAATGIC